MSPSREKYYRGLFMTSAIYDGFLGIIFAFFFVPAFEILGIREMLPPFGGYLSLLGAFVLVIGVAYYLISRGDLWRNLDLILIGVLYKLAYCVTVLYYALTGNVPHLIFVAVFGVADLIFFILMTECYIFLRKTAPS